MHHVFEIETTVFQGVAPRPAALNELIGGDEMATWINGELKRSGYECSEIWADDHGWDFNIALHGRTYLVVSSCDFERINEPTTWHAVQLAHHRSLADKIFGRNKPFESDTLLTAVRDALQGNPTFSVIAERKL